jgi:hypothetical protein
LEDRLNRISGSRQSGLRRGQLASRFFERKNGGFEQTGVSRFSLPVSVMR